MLFPSTASIGRAAFAACICLVTFCLVSQSNAQDNPGRYDDDRPAFEDQFWKYLIGNNYKNWAPGPGQSTGFYPGKNPHGELLKMYMNRTAAGTIGDLAIGSVVILENYTRDQTLSTISVMYRTTDFNPSGNDWYWVEYLPDGTVKQARPAPKQLIQKVSLKSQSSVRLRGKATQCIQCHQSAGGGDFMFTNDFRNQTPVQQSAPRQNQPLQNQPLEDETVKADSDSAGSADADFVADADAEDFFGTR